MTHINPRDVDMVLENYLPDDYVLEFVRRSCRKQHLPEIEVSAQQGRFLESLVAISGATRVLEIGTLGGYSTICLARGAGEYGKVCTLEYDRHHAAVAVANFKHTNMLSRIAVYVGPALETLPTLEQDINELLIDPFDFVFIDADKESNAAYVDWACRLTTSGATILVDNVIRDGRVLAADRPEKLEFIRAFSEHPSLTSKSVIQTVGSKGWDGFALARKR